MPEDEAGNATAHTRSNFQGMLPGTADGASDDDVAVVNDACKEPDDYSGQTYDSATVYAGAVFRRAKTTGAAASAGSAMWTLYTKNDGHLVVCVASPQYA